MEGGSTTKIKHIITINKKVFVPRGGLGPLGSPPRPVPNMGKKTIISTYKF